MKAANFNFKADWLTTVTGLILLLTTVLVTFGVLTPEQSTGIQTQTTTILQAVSGIIGAVSSIILMFSGKQ
jgi:uncharacterized membrane protein HdeD (DUF308 family)